MDVRPEWVRVRIAGSNLLGAPPVCLRIGLGPGFPRPTEGNTGPVGFHGDIPGPREGRARGDVDLLMSGGLHVVRLRKDLGSEPEGVVTGRSARDFREDAWRWSWVRSSRKPPGWRAPVPSRARAGLFSIPRGGEFRASPPPPTLRPVSASSSRTQTSCSATRPGSRRHAGIGWSWLGSPRTGWRWRLSRPGSAWACSSRPRTPPSRSDGTSSNRPAASSEGQPSPTSASGCTATQSCGLEPGSGPKQPKPPSPRPGPSSPRSRCREGRTGPPTGTECTASALRTRMTGTGRDRPSLPRCRLRARSSPWGHILFARGQGVHRRLPPRECHLRSRPGRRVHHASADRPGAPTAPGSLRPRGCQGHVERLPSLRRVSTSGAPGLVDSLPGRRTRVLCVRGAGTRRGPRRPGSPGGVACPRQPAFPARVDESVSPGNAASAGKRLLTVARGSSDYLA